MESFLWRSDPSQSIFDLDWFIRRTEQLNFKLLQQIKELMNRTNILLNIRCVIGVLGYFL